MPDYNGINYLIRHTNKIPQALGLGVGAGMFDFGLNQLQNIINTDRYFDYEEKAAQNAFNRQLAIINGYQTPKAQVRMLKEAGLSPGLALSNGVTGVSGANAPQGGGAPNQELSSLGLMQNALTAAQIRNIDANTKKTQTETESNIRQNDLFDATFYDQIDSVKARAELDKANAAYQKLVSQAATDNEEEFIENMQDSWRQLSKQLSILNHDDKIKEYAEKVDSATWQTKIDTINEQLNKLINENNQLKADTKLTLLNFDITKFDSMWDAKKWLVEECKKGGLNDNDAWSIAETIFEGGRTLKEMKDLIKPKPEPKEPKPKPKEKK